METLSVAIGASTYGRDPTQLVSRVVHYDRRDRMRRAARAFFPLLGIGLALVVVPPHLITLAGFLIAGSVLGVRRWLQRHEVLALEGSCPGCAQVGSYPPPRDFPAIVRCPRCGSYLKLERLASAGPTAHGQRQPGAEQQQSAGSGLGNGGPGERAVG